MELSNHSFQGKAPPPRTQGLVPQGSPANSRYANLKLDEPANRWPWIVAAVLLLLLLGAAGAYYLFREDPELAKAREVLDEMSPEKMKDLTREQRREKWKEVRDVLDNLTDEQRQALRKERFEKMRQRENERLKRYFAMSPEEKTQYLDEQIDRSEAWRERFEERRKQWAEERERRKQEAAAKGETFKEDNPRRGWGPGRNQWSKMTPEERENRRKQWLDNSTADERAQRWQYMQDVKARRLERGLPATGGFGGWGGRWGR
jgi:hypothetical protein